MLTRKTLNLWGVMIPHKSEISADPAYLLF